MSNTTDRTSTGLRESMFKVLDSVMSGDISPAQANAAARAADQVVKTLMAEIAVREYSKNYPKDNDPVTTRTLKLT